MFWYPDETVLLVFFFIYYFKIKTFHVVSVRIKSMEYAFFCRCTKELPWLWLTGVSVLDLKKRQGRDDSDNGRRPEFMLHNSVLHSKERSPLYFISLCFHRNASNANRVRRQFDIQSVRIPVCELLLLYLLHRVLQGKVSCSFSLLLFFCF